MEDVTKVTVYSNQPEVELFANGVSLGKKTAEDHFFYFDVPNSGETRLEAVAGDLRDESFIRKVDTFNEDYRLKEQNAVLNWFDITEKEGCFCLNDKIGDIMATISGKIWIAGFALMLKGKMDANKKAKCKEEKKGGGFSINLGDMKGMTQALGGFTVLRLTGLLSMVGVALNKEELLKLNKQLNKIRKPKAK